MELIRNLSIRVLTACFVHQDMARSEIMRQIFSRLLTGTEATAPFLLLLEELSFKCPAGVQDHIVRMRSLLDYLCFLPQDIAAPLMEIVAPFICNDPQLLNALMLVLKKGIFNRELTSRTVSLLGYISILTALQNVQLKKGDELTAEILSTLQRCLSQQSSLKSTLYGALAKLSQGGNSFEISSFCIDMLYRQFNRYLEDQPAAAFPLTFDTCVLKSEIVEPLPNLIVALGQACESMSRISIADDVFDSSILDLCSTLLDSMRKKLTLYTPQSADAFAFSLPLSDLVVGSYEALIELEMVYGKCSPKTVLDMVEKIVSVTQFNFGTLLKGKFPRCRAMSLVACRELSMKFISSDHSWDKLKGGNVFVWYAGTTLLALHTLESSLTPLASDDFNNIKIIFKHVRNAVFRGKEGDWSAEILENQIMPLVGILDSCLRVVSKTSPQKLIALVRTSTPSMSTEDPADLLMPFFDDISLLVKSVMELDATYALKSVGSLMLHLEVMISRFAISKQAALDLSEQLRHVLADAVVQDVSFVRGIMSVVLSLHNRTGSWKDCFDLIIDSKRVLGTYELRNTQPEAQVVELKICSKKTVYPIISTILGACGQYLDDIEWLLNTGVTDHESSVFDQLHSIIKIMVILGTSHMSEQGEALFTNLTKSYRNMTKIIRSKMSADSTVSKKLVELIACISSEMTQAVYSFISFVQAQDIEKAKQRAQSGKSKKGKVAVAKGDKKNKMIPILIYEIEQYENLLIRLSKRCKVNLTRYCKRSTSRDFKIELENLPTFDDDSEDENIKGNYKKRAKIAE
eukprot:Partr_v1_DN28673_c0_g1_i2_m50411 putative Fanconi anemia, complementation group I